MQTVVVAALMAATLHASAWFLTHRTMVPPESETTFQSLSFAPYARNQNPSSGDVPTPEQINRDLARIAPYTRAVRTYTATGGPDLVPMLARNHSLTVSVGAWVDTDEERSQREIEAAVELTRTYRNVRSVLVGNEMLSREDKTVEEAIRLIQQVKKRVKVPVSTGEIWNVWLENPQLVNAADFIAAHILPYWEGMPADQAVSYALSRLDELRRAYPGKRIVVAEFGWPSNGANKSSAKADPVLQGQVIRHFLAEARRRGIEYNVVEAFDQPWKDFEDHGVGPYWGVFDANRRLKFPLTGVVENPAGRFLAGASLVVGLGLTMAGLCRRPITFGHALAYAVAANALGMGLVMAGAYPFLNYMSWGTWFMWGMGSLMLLPLVLISLTKVHEMAKILLGLRPCRLITPFRFRPTPLRWPKVSVHIPAYREQPDMLKATLDAVAALDYPSFEVLVILNNTPEEYYWKPIEEHCMRLGERFKFIYLPKVTGFKAGAMNAALPFMATDAEIIAVIDADYVVHRDWVKDLVPYFADPKVGFVQAPQDHRDGHESFFRRMMKWEYDGFFDIGMVQRNEDNAIIAHGTMLLICRTAFEQVGGWLADTIVEDSELGLRLFEAGYTAHYTNTRYGWGILPDTYKAFKIQRHRWVYGAVQIFKKHRLHMLPGVAALSWAQKMHYLTGWFYWLSDALGALMALLNLAWVPVVLFIGLAIPPALTMPLVAAFAINVMHNVLLYRVRVKASLVDTVGAAIAAMSLQLTIAKAVYDGFIKDNIPFQRTAKGGNAGNGIKRKNDTSAAWLETAVGLLLLLSAVLVRIMNPDRATNLDLFALTLLIQAVPFLSATVMYAIERGQDKLQILNRRRAILSVRTGHVAPQG